MIVFDSDKPLADQPTEDLSTLLAIIAGVLAFRLGDDKAIETLGNVREALTRMNIKRCDA